MNAVKCSEVCNDAPRDRRHPGLPQRATHAGREAGRQTDRPSHRPRKQTNEGKNGEFNYISKFSKVQAFVMDIFLNFFLFLAFLRYANMKLGRVEDNSTLANLLLQRVFSYMIVR